MSTRATNATTSREQPPRSDEPRFELVAPVSFEAEAGTAGGSDEKLPARFTGTAYSGEMVPSYGAVIDLSSTRMAKRLPLLNSHWRDDVIGFVDSSSVGERIEVSGELFSDMEGCSAKKIARLAKRGAPYQMSVGLFGYRETFVPAGQSVKVNGREFTGPINVLSGGTVREVSIVTLGADWQADVTLLKQPTHQPTTARKPNMDEIDQLKAAVAELTEQLNAAKAEADALRAAAETARVDNRKAAVAALAAEVGQEFDADTVEAYVGLSDAAFRAVGAGLRALSKRSEGALLSEQAVETSGTRAAATAATPAVLSASEIYAARRSQAAAA